MANIKECIECGEEFDLNSPAKKKAGGLATTCPDCSEESAVRRLALVGSSGKQQRIEILAFDNAADREAMKAGAMANNGYHRGHGCQMGSPVSVPQSGFRRVGTNGGIQRR
jgi:hypothetical protein